MVNTAYSHERAPAIPVQKTEHNIKYGTCSICYDRRITVLLECVSYRIPSMRNRVRELLFCADRVECVSAAMARART